MEQRSRGSWALKALFISGTLCCSVALGLLASGCSSSRAAARRQGFMRVVTPRPPAFFTGPASVLFTNWPGFSAHVEVQAHSGQPADLGSSGQLLGRGARLVYAPDSGETTDTHHLPGGYSFIWNVAESRGFVLSEALQGYAPVSADLHVTNIDLKIGRAPAQRLSGHPCEPASASVLLADGTVAAFTLWRAIDLNGFPIRIESATNAAPFTLIISKLHLEQPPAAVFAPPDGFTKYATPEAMADELAARQNNLRRRSSGQMEPILPGMERGRY